ATNGSGSNGALAATPTPAPAPYDDGFGPMPDIPARESGYRNTRAAPRNTIYRGIPYVSAHQLGMPRGTTAITMSSGTTAQQALDWIREKAEAVVDAVGDTVSPPSLYRLGSDSATFIDVWEKALGVASWIPGTGGIYGFLKGIPALARTSGVTLSIGPALDTPLFGGGVGVVFAPDGDVALFGQGEISVDAEGLLEFVKSLKATLQAKLKLGYNHSGLAGFESMAKVAGVSAGAEVVVGAECWLDGNGHGLGGAVSIGVGFALQLAADDARPTHGVPFVSAQQLGLPATQTAITLSSGTTARDALDWIREKAEAVVDAVGDTVSPPSLYRLGSDSATFISVWEKALGVASWIPGAGGVYGFLKAIPELARTTDVTLSVGPALDTPLFGGGVGVVFAPDGQVALFGQGDISVDADGLLEFVKSLKLALQAKLKLGYNHSGLAGFESMAKVAGISAGAEIVVGAECWLDGNGQGLGGAVSIGVGFALQLAAQQADEQAALAPGMPSYVPPPLPQDPRQRAVRIGGGFGQRVGEALDLGLDGSTLSPLLDKLDPPLGAVPLGARAMNAPVWSVHWDGVHVIPQPDPNGCWATTIAMMMGWRDSKSYDPAAIARQCGRDISAGLPWAERDDAARALGLGTVAPQCYTPEGFRSLIENHGPLYVGKIMSGTINSGHAVLVTGMYSDGSDHFVRVADPWDRGVGTPGNPDPYGGTHATGSQYIMTFETFMLEYEMAASGSPANVQIIYGGVPFGRAINTSTSAPAGYAMEVDPRRRAGKTGRILAKAKTGVETAAAIAGVAVSIIYGSGGGDIDYYLPEWKGKKHPRDVAPTPEAAFSKAVIPIVGWPTAGGAYANCEIKWEYNGTSIANVYVRRGEPNDTIGWGVTVRGNVEDDAATYARSPASGSVGADQVAALNVVLDYTFQAPVLTDDASARIQVKLYGDGTYEIDREWIKHSDAAFHQFTEPEAYDRPRMSHLVPLT
ncbi:MAG TPA: papain-like cysteine protease family protein, partial [Qipengyuania sp.]|nr:papain-like cysteine protease family protein [Qipengyuania sp.]